MLKYTSNAVYMFVREILKHGFISILQIQIMDKSNLFGSNKIERIRIMGCKRDPSDWLPSKGTNNKCFILYYSFGKVQSFEKKRLNDILYEWHLMNKIHQKILLLFPKL